MANVELIYAILREGGLEVRLGEEKVWLRADPPGNTGRMRLKYALRGNAGVDGESDFRLQLSFMKAMGVEMADSGIVSINTEISKEGGEIV